MIGQYLSNTNEKATVSILQNILELNKAHIWKMCGSKSIWVFIQKKNIWNGGSSGVR